MIFLFYFVMLAQITRATKKLNIELYHTMLISNLVLLIFLLVLSIYLRRVEKLIFENPTIF